ncbi:hypothetical protein PR202_gb27925 [Eleusine coracana subsp. coracana]|uniref:Uncharacterized protein n=1 Tax=Eleusine coracana subsp. coracana TaxID=191504 RepID=A0AAV5FW44_ELECO|nr:hypothetical protein PR202_gb27925 [Eleusine coracana subsp. coracana]
MQQGIGEDEPPPQAEGDAQPAADAPAEDATPMEEVDEDGPAVAGDEDGPAVAAAADADADAGAADPVMGPASPEGAGPEEGDDGEERSGVPAVDAIGEAEKLENGDGVVKADGEKGSEVEEEGGSDGENKGVGGQNQPAENQFVLGRRLRRTWRSTRLWRQVTGLGGYDQVTSCKLWRQVGESFKPPKTCTTVSWTFRNFYEKALLEYEKHKIETGEFHVATSTLSDRIGSESQVSHASGSGRARRESATRAMQGWHSQRMLGNGEIADPIIKDKGSIVLKKDKTPKSNASAKRKRTPSEDDRVIPYKSDKLHKNCNIASCQILHSVPSQGNRIKHFVNVPSVFLQKDCYEVYALVPGLLREEVHVQSDPAGRLIVTGEPEQLDNPWGVTPFKKVISLPSRIDPHQTSAVVTLHGQLFVRAPFEQPK